MTGVNRGFLIGVSLSINRANQLLRSVIIMARTQNTTKVKSNNNIAAVCIVGEIAGVFEGKEHNYITIKVNRDDINPKTNKPYYDNIKVTADASLELFDDGTVVEIDGVLRQYFDRMLSRSTMYVVANSIKNVSTG